MPAYKTVAELDKLIAQVRDMRNAAAYPEELAVLDAHEKMLMSARAVVAEMERLDAAESN